MDENTLNLVKQSDSTIIVLIFVVVALIALRPVIKIWIAAKEKSQQMQFAQQDKIIAVIQANTEVNASLKTVLEEDRKLSMEFRKEQQMMFRQIQDNQDLANIKLVEIYTMLKKEESTNVN